MRADTFHLCRACGAYVIAAEKMKAGMVACKTCWHPEDDCQCPPVSELWELNRTLDRIATTLDRLVLELGPGPGR